MAVDLGTKRIGIALSDPGGMFASPLTVIHRKGGRRDLQAIADLAKDYQVETIVVGLPVDLRGQEAIAAGNAQAEVEQLRQLTPLPVETYDERLTSAAAQRAMRDGGLGREQRKDNIDKVAAAMLLQSYLDRLRHQHAAQHEQEQE